MSTHTPAVDAQDEFARFFLLGLGVALAFVLLKLLYHGRPENLFVGLETIILCVVSGLSTGNYYLTNVAMTEAGSPLKGAHFWRLIFINLALFVAATILVEETEIFALVIAAIYLMFSFSNTTQVLSLAASNQSTEPHFRATVTSAIWLKEENGLSVIAFTVVLGTLLFITLWHLFWVSSHPTYDNFYFQIKAFAGGAATFHLVVSVSKYWLIYRKKDVVETTLRSLNAKVVAHPQNASLGDLFNLSDSLRQNFRISGQGWRKALLWLGIFASVFAFSSWGLNRWKHHHGDIPCPPQEAQYQSTNLSNILIIME